jgi:hypothetical protein
MQEMRGNEDWLKHRGISPGDARAIARKRGPTDGSVNAFVQWLQRINHTGEFYKSELFELYEWACELTGERPKTCDKWFKQEMRGCGCTTGKTDKRVKGKGSRKVTIIVPREVTSDTSLPTPDKSVPTSANAHSKPIAKAIQYLSEPLAEQIAA